MYYRNHLINNLFKVQLKIMSFLGLENVFLGIDSFQMRSDIHDISSRSPIVFIF
jgi:hypothetical protein